MKKRIFWSITAITLLSVFFFNIIISNFLYQNFLDLQKSNLKNELKYIEKLYYDNPENKEFLSSNRITIVTKNGLVIFDTEIDYKNLDNHLKRPEISDALEKGFGENIRTSDTFNEDTYYVAKKLDDENVLRLSFTTASILGMLYSSLPTIFLWSFIYLCFAILLTNFVTKRIIDPITSEKKTIYDELLPFLQKIEKQQNRIDKQKYQLEQKMTEFNVISDNIADGLILLDANEHILMMNKKASKTLGNQNINYVGRPMIDLLRLQIVQNALKKAYKGEFVFETVELCERFYSFRFSPVIQDENIIGVVLLIVDNTKKIEAEKIRQEFSANVSHELRTPLTSISGYAELIKNDMVEQKDIIPFAKNIHSEAVTLINLIEDIIKISRLDENKSFFGKTTVNLNSLVEQTLSRLHVQTTEKNLTVTATLLDVDVMGVEQILSEICYNVIENGIKYNKLNGSLDIIMSLDDEYVIIDVINTGHHIPKDQINRIFERFYRVDTSHSKKITGSGLGLSIVKHGVNLHDGKIEVSSEENGETSFTIYLKK